MSFGLGGHARAVFPLDTTVARDAVALAKSRFDVEIELDTTILSAARASSMLRFDVGLPQYNICDPTK